jgi:trimethylamine monooxygenase
MADYSFEEHFGQQIPSFPPRAVLADYILGRASASKIRDLIRFEHAARHVTFDENTKMFTVIVEDLQHHVTSCEEFDYVAVCGGHFSTPHVPSFAGIERFPGRVQHAHDFRDALEFKGKTVLIVGASYSAEDIGLQLHKYGAERVIMTYRTAAMGFDWPEGMEERPLLTRFEGNTVHFKDNTSATVDAVILCTGYQHHFPYMEDSLRLRTLNRLCTDDLYRGVVWMKNPQLFYLGMQDQWYTFTMFDAQAWLARDIIMGRFKVPELAERQASFKDWRAKEEAAGTAFEQIDYQTDYVRDLCGLTDYPDFDIEACRDMFKEWKRDKKASITGYRDKAFPSPVTGTMAPVHHTPWLKAMDDSLECFLQSSQ